MKIHYLKHEKFEDLACIRKWTDSNDIEVTCTELYSGQRLPVIIDFDLLIILGGSMNVYEEDKYSWLVEEKVFIKNVIDQGIAVLGICLGAQLLSCVLGGVVTRNKYTEIGWYPISNFGSQKFFPIEEGPNVFHWHGDTFSIPEGATKLYTSEACENQGFVFNLKVVGLQFHLETDEAAVNSLCDSCASELVEAKYIQDAQTMKTLAKDYVSSANEIMFKLLDKLLLN